MPVLDVHRPMSVLQTIVAFGRVARVAYLAGSSVEQSAEWLLCGIHEGRLMADSTRTVSGQLAALASHWLT